MSNLFVEIQPAWLEIAIMGPLTLVFGLVIKQRLRHVKRASDGVILRARSEHNSLIVEKYLDQNWNQLWWLDLGYNCAIIPMMNGILYRALPAFLIQQYSSIGGATLAFAVGIVLVLVQLLWYGDWQKNVRFRDRLALFASAALLLAVALITGSLTVTVAVDTVINLPSEIREYIMTRGAIKSTNRRVQYLTLRGQSQSYIMKYAGRQS